jgi:hypothetical protein
MRVKPRCYRNGFSMDLAPTRRKQEGKIFGRLKAGMKIRFTSVDSNMNNTSTFSILTQN